MARPHGREQTPLLPVAVRDGEELNVALVAGQAGTLRYVVKDQGGRYLPSKLNIGRCFPECAVNDDCPSDRPVCDLDSNDPVAKALSTEDQHGICIAKGGYSGPEACRPDQVWSAARKVCTCPTTGRLPISQGGHLLSDGTVEFFHSTGKGEVHVEPGKYQVLISRGPEYDISRQFVHIKPGMVTRLAATLPRQVDTSGWISADFHVHGPNSVDASATYTKRLKSMVAEGVELFAATDHDYISDYGPRIHELGLQGWNKSTSGMEVSPIDYGHFIGFPLRYDRRLEQNGGFHWRVSKKTGTFGPTDDDFENMPPGKIFSSLRELGSLGLERTVVFVAHFYDYFTNYEMDPWTLKLPLATDMFSPIAKRWNTALDPNNFAGDFDALEGFNGKEFDILRRPTYTEVRDYNAKLAKLLKDSGTWGFERRQQAWRKLSASAQREFIIRTADEQKLAISYNNPSFQCRCASDSECGSGSVCNELTGGCVTKAKSTRCTTDSECSATLVTAKREQCTAIPTSITGGSFCQRLDKSCTADTDCTDSFGKDSSGGDITETCISATSKCGFVCTRDEQCTKDPLRPLCDRTNKVCIGITAATAADPCPLLRGTVDDWFQMLNHGVNRTFLGNSDTHGTYGTESGIPRNYVKSSTDLPRAVDVGEVADNVRASKTFPSYGPFLEFTVDGKPMGATVSRSKGSSVSLRLKVQSATWYDVDRIEIYKNGALIKEITGKKDCALSDSSCIQSPNKQVLNYDGTFSDKVDRDSWYVAVVMGVNGRTMAPIYSSKPVARLGMFELIQRLTPLLPPLASFRVPLSPSMSTVRPYALTNPIYVDTDGDSKFTPLSALPSWATSADQSKAGKSTTTSSPASASSAADGAPPAHSHDHRPGLGRMRLDAKKFQQLVNEGKITPRHISSAMNSLRRYHMGGH